MKTAVFDYDEFYQLIERFAQDAPTILASHHTTADLVPRVHGLLDSLDATFTVAVVGQMRSGKSSLLNALVGADLAVTGVNETTATVNHFMYGSGEQCKRFRAVWKDRPAEEFPWSEIQKWVGDSERARATRRLEFFADLEFLRSARVVDTPGTRSTINFHEDATKEFLGLADRHDSETRRQGAAADAIIYVLMPVARKSDQDLLSDFEQNTRLPGASPYNSLGVVHKWETMSVEDPLAEALGKAQHIAAVMGDLVSDVIPVSSPLARAAEQLPDTFWSKILVLATECPDEVLEELLLTDRDFAQATQSRCPLSLSERKSVRSMPGLPWPSLKVIIRQARQKRPGNVTDLRAEVRNASGIDQLRNALQRRFFARSKMIKAFSVLSKAWEPCQIANVRLRYHKTRSVRLLDAAQKALRSVSDCGVSAAALATVRDYVEETRSLVEDDLRKAGDLLRSLGEVTVILQDAYDDMNQDLQMLERLSVHEDAVGPQWTRMLRHLFGGAGPEIQHRIGPLLAESKEHAELERVEAAIGELRTKSRSGRDEAREIFEHGLDRLEQIADCLEQNEKPQTKSRGERHGVADDCH